MATEGSFEASTSSHDHLPPHPLGAPAVHAAQQAPTYDSRADDGDLEFADDRSTASMLAYNERYCKRKVLWAQAIDDGNYEEAARIANLDS